MSKRLRKVVFPVAGLGTRFLPATKVVAKEMLPVLDRPLIQYAVDEAVDAGADTLVFVTNRYKHAIADYFDKAYELEAKLADAGKDALLQLVKGTLPRGVRCVLVARELATGTQPRMQSTTCLCVVADRRVVPRPKDAAGGRRAAAGGQSAQCCSSCKRGAAIRRVPRPVGLRARAGRGVDGGFSRWRRRRVRLRLPPR